MMQVVLQGPTARPSTGSWVVRTSQLVAEGHPFQELKFNHFYLKGFKIWTPLYMSSPPNTSLSETNLIVTAFNTDAVVKTFGKFRRDASVNTASVIQTSILTSGEKRARLSCRYNSDDAAFMFLTATITGANYHNIVSIQLETGAPGEMYNDIYVSLDVEVWYDTNLLDEDDPMNRPFRFPPEVETLLDSHDLPDISSVLSAP